MGIEKRTGGGVNSEVMEGWWMVRIREILHTLDGGVSDVAHGDGVVERTEKTKVRTRTESRQRRSS